MNLYILDNGIYIVADGFEEAVRLAVLNKCIFSSIKLIEQTVIIQRIV